MKNEKITKNLKKITVVLAILFVATVTSLILITKNIKKEHNNEVVQLKTEIYNLNYKLETKESLTDSLFTILESNKYLYWLIEEESSIKIPDYVKPEHVRLMYEEAIIKNIPIDIMFRLVYQESRFYSNAQN